MAQSNELMALRNRLTRRGYTDVSIQLQDSGTYLVSAIEPLGKWGVQVEVAPDDIPHVGRW